jgi:glycosyltransferase involved in cell wall biosynthesis
MHARVKPPPRVAFVSVLPSPYQRDLFAALAARPEVALRVFYMEREAPDSPWPTRPLAAYEQYLPGFWFGLSHARVHCNWRLPRAGDFDLVVCNTLMSVTGQWLMRVKLRGQRWMFWGEKLGRRSPRHDRLTAPLRKAAGIAAIGAWAQTDYQERFPGVPVFNIPYHCSLEAFRAAPRPAQPRGDVTFLFCGQMIARKGLDLLLTAFAALPENTRLLLVGREAELPQLLAPLSPATRARIEYAGFHAPEALPALFARADVFVLPSRYDGWGVVVNQALGAGLPIVVSDKVGAGYDLVTAGVNGDVFRAGDAIDLEAKMRAFAEWPGRHGGWGTASRAHSEAWDPEDGAERWVRALLQIAR